MKAIGWIIAGILVVWYFATRGTSTGGSSGGFLSGLLGGTSGGIDTGGTASPGGSIIPLGTVSQGGGISGTGIIPVASGTSHGSPGAGTSGGLSTRINSNVNPNGPFQLQGSTPVTNVQVPSIIATRGNYYSPPALPTPLAVKQRIAF